MCATPPPGPTHTHCHTHTLSHTHTHTHTHLLTLLDFSSGLEGGLAEVAIEVLHLLLSHLLESPEDEVGVNKEAVETFVRTMRQDFPRERVPVVLAPLLYREQQDITEDRYKVVFVVV